MQKFVITLINQIYLNKILGKNLNIALKGEN